MDVFRMLHHFYTAPGFVKEKTLFHEVRISKSFCTLNYVFGFICAIKTV